jgi:hypothetical protein
MDKNQKIKCNVNSCTYNDEQGHKCELEEIVVQPNFEMATGEPEDESMCGSYEPEEE